MKRNLKFLAIIAAAALMVSCENTTQVSEHQKDYPNIVRINGRDYKASKIDFGGHRDITIIYPIDSTQAVPLQIQTIRTQGKQQVTESLAIFE